MLVADHLMRFGVTLYALLTVHPVSLDHALVTSKRLSTALVIYASHVHLYTPHPHSHLPLSHMYTPHPHSHLPVSQFTVLRCAPVLEAFVPMLIETDCLFGMHSAGKVAAVASYGR